MKRNFKIFRNQLHSIVVFEAKTKRAKKWLETNLDTQPWQWFGPCVYVDPSYANEIIEAIENEF